MPRSNQDSTSARRNHRLGANTVPAITLSKEDERELRQLGADLKREFMGEYEDYLYGRKRRVDVLRWKEIRHKDDVHVYRERVNKHTTRGAAISSASSSSSSPSVVDELSSVKSSSSASDSGNASTRGTMEIGPHSAMAASSRVQVLMATGSAPGTVDDALYGATVRDTASQQTRCTYLHEDYEDGGVLAVLDGATSEDPYRVLGINWYLKVVPMFNLVRPRDLLHLVSVQTAYTSRGERVGLAMYHSITHPSVPERDGVLRARNSFCSLFRQLDDHRIDIYTTQFMDLMGIVLESIVQQEMAQILLSQVNMANIGLKKKLFWLMRDARHRRPQLSSQHSDASSSTDSSNGGAHSGRHASCASCDKTLGKFLSSHGSVCQLCFKTVCSKCYVTKKIVIDAESATRKPFDFCIVCMMAARSTSTKSIAQRELEYGSAQSRASPMGAMA